MPGLLFFILKESSNKFHIIITISSIFEHKYSVILESKFGRQKEEQKLIEINHLVKKYGNHTAVDDLTLSVEPGKIYGFLGPNGAGKTTTMNMITGYLGATSGEVKINGFDIFMQPEEAKKCIGYLPEIPPLYLEMTVEEYLFFAAELKKIEKKHRKAAVEEAMELTRISEVKGRMIRNLSKGYRQRVGLAQAVLGFPEVLILDEPTVGLDPKQMIEIRDLIKELGKKHTIILSSHILTEISAVCDYVFIISKGKLVASDSKENLLNLMTGSRELEILVKADNEQAIEILQTIEEIEHCTVLTSPEEGAALLRIIAAKFCEGDIRQMVFNTCAKEKLPILEMRTVSKSLEEVFLELTAQEGGKIE